MKSDAGRPFGGLVRLLYPDRCTFCGKVIRPYGEVCTECSGNLPKITGEICLNCGREKRFCNCYQRRFEFSGCIAPFYYEGLAKKGILRIKFGRRLSGTVTFARYAADCVRKHYADKAFDLVTNVPLTRGELRRRGFNQSALFAKALAEQLKLPYAETLEKPCETKPQRNCSKSERWGNVFGAFRATPQARGKILLLADDIMTTGATLNECAKMLRLAGAREVWCIVEGCVKGKN